MVNLEEFSQDDVKKLPAVIEAVVISVELKPAAEIYENPINQDDDMIIIKCQNAEHDIIHSQHFKFYSKEKLTDNTHMGKYLKKYGNLKSGNIVTLIKKKNKYEVALE